MEFRYTAIFHLDWTVLLVCNNTGFFFYLFILHSGSVNGFMRIVFSIGYWNMIIIWFRSKTSQLNTMALVSTSIIWSVYQVFKIKYLYACVCTAKKKTQQNMTNFSTTYKLSKEKEDSLWFILCIKCKEMFVNNKEGFK